METMHQESVPLAFLKFKPIEWNDFCLIKDSKGGEILKYCICKLNWLQPFPVRLLL